MKIKGLLSALALVLSITSFAQSSGPKNTAGDNLDIDWKAFQLKVQEAARKAAEETDRKLEEEMRELTEVDPELLIMTEDMRCVSLLTLEVELLSKRSAKMYKRSFRKALLKQIKEEKQRSRCNY